MPSPAASPPRAARAAWLPLALVFAVALVARLVYLFVCWRAELLRGLFLDSAAYVRIASGGVGENPYLLSPLYPYFLALFPGIGDDPLTQTALATRVVQALLGAGTCALTALAGLRLGGRAVGLGAGLALGIYGPAIHFDAGVLVAGPQAFLLALALAIAVGDAPERGAADLRRAGRWAAVGAALGLAAALRPTALAIVVGTLAVLVYDALVCRRSGASARALPALGLVLGAALAVAPFTARNLVVGGEPVLLSAGGGFNFWVGNHAGARGFFEQPPGYDFESDPVGHRLAARELGGDVGHRAASSWWRRRALDDVKAAPGAWLGLLGRKVLLFLHPGEIPQLGWSFDWHRTRAWPLRVPLDARWVLLLALAAPFIEAVRGGRAALARLRLPLVFVAVYAAAICLFFVTARYRAPAMPAAMLLAAIAVQGGFRVAAARFAPRPRRGIAVVLLLAAGIAGSYALYDGRFGLPDATGFQESQRGVRLVAEGRYGEAVEVFERAFEHGDTNQARASYAEALRGLGRSRDALDQYELIVDRDPRNTTAWFNTGNLLWEDLRDAAGAERSFRECIRLRPADADARFNLGAVLLQTRRFRAAITELEEALRLAPADVHWRSEAERALGIARQRARVENGGG